MNIDFTEMGWEDYQYWQENDRKTLSRINALLRDISRNGNKGIGKPEPLMHDLSGFWSRRIDRTNRLVHRIQDGKIVVVSCRYHYGP